MHPVYVRCRKIPWIPACVAQHTRVLVANTEHFFVKRGNPRHQPAADSTLFIHDVYIGEASVGDINHAIKNVDPHFPDGSYHLLHRDCARYVFCLCTALFGSQIVIARFPISCNTLQNCLHGFDLRVIINAAGLCDHLQQCQWQSVTNRLRLSRRLEMVVRAAVPAV
jgi:hypothetical protein